MDNWSNDSNVAEFVHGDWSVGEEFLTVLIGFCFSSFVVISIGLFQNIRRNSDVLGELLSVVVSLHDSSSDVMFTVPFDFIGGLRIQYKSERSFVFEHFSRDIISSS